jgi:hypothetical protein
MFLSPRSRLWRWQVGEFARRKHVTQDDYDALSAAYGKTWAWSRRDEIMELEPPPIVVEHTPATEFEDEKTLTLWDIWNADRHLFCQAYAAAAGITHQEAYAEFFMNMKKTLEFEVPKWCGQSHRKTDDFDCGPDPVDVTRVWSDGRVERM